MLSTFAIVILLMLAAAVSNNYRCGSGRTPRKATHRTQRARPLASRSPRRCGLGADPIALRRPQLLGAGVEGR